MVEQKKPLTNFDMVVFAWLLVGLTLWVLFVPAPVQSFVLDETVQLEEGSESEAFQGVSPACWLWASDQANKNEPLLCPVSPDSSPTAEDVLAGILFRLRLVRLHPPVGPPRTFFATPATG
jgi:hypothetical protein